MDRPKSFKKRFIQIGSDLLELSLGQTDGQTDGHFFFADSASLGIGNQLCPWKHMFFPRVTNVDLNLLDLVLRTGLKTRGVTSFEVEQCLILFTIKTPYIYNIKSATHTAL